MIYRRGIQLNRLDLEKGHLNMVLKEIITLKNQKNAYVVGKEEGVICIAK